MCPPALIPLTTSTNTTSSLITPPLIPLTTAPFITLTSNTSNSNSSNSNSMVVINNSNTSSDIIAKLGLSSNTIGSGSSGRLGLSINSNNSSSYSSVSATDAVVSSAATRLSFSSSSGGLSHVTLAPVTPSSLKSIPQAQVSTIIAGAGRRSRKYCY